MRGHFESIFMPFTCLHYENALKNGNAYYSEHNLFSLERSD